MRIARIVVVPGVFGLGVLCCQQVLSIDGAIEIRDASVDAVDSSNVGDAGMDAMEAAPEAAVTVDACGLAIVPGAGCASCVTASCCSQLTTCAGDPTCAKLESCLLSCGSDYGCRAACVLDNPVKVPIDVPTLDACVAGSCHTQCGMACGLAGSYTTPDGGAACESCIASSPACTPALTCAASVACEISGHCAYACPTPDCRAACASDGGDDNALVNSAFLAGALCYQPCQIGEDWSCVGTVQWPPSPGATQQVTISLLDLANGNTPIVGAAAAACKVGDPCTTPLSTGTTDDAGLVTLTNLGSVFPLGFSGHFQLIPTSTYEPSDYYLSFPLSVADAQLTLTLLTQATFNQAFTDLGIAPLSGRGHVWVVAEDCLQIPASRVVVKADGLTDPQARTVYLANGTVSPGATSTDPTGSVYFLNVPQGALTLHATPLDTGIESSEAEISVEPGLVSIVWLLPTAIP